MPPKANRPPNAKPQVPVCRHCGSLRLSTRTPQACFDCGRFTDNTETVTLVCPVCHREKRASLATVPSEITCDGCHLTISVADIPSYNAKGQ